MRNNTGKAMEDRSEAAEVFRALGDGTRLRIVQLLLREGEMCVCRIVPELGLPQSTVSHHLATLRHAGLVRQRREGQMIFYRCVSSEALDAALGLLLEMAGQTQREREAAPA